MASVLRCTAPEVEGRRMPPARHAGRNLDSGASLSQAPIPTQSRDGLLSGGPC